MLLDLSQILRPELVAKEGSKDLVTDARIPSHGRNRVLASAR